MCVWIFQFMVGVGKDIREDGGHDDDDDDEDKKSTKWWEFEKRVNHPDKNILSVINWMFFSFFQTSRKCPCQ